MKSTAMAKLEQVDEFQDRLPEMVQKCVEEKMKEMQQQYGEGGMVADIMGVDPALQMKKALLMKADKIDIEKMYEIKSNKQDTENMLDCQQLMCKQFKHILVLFIELVNFSNNARKNEPSQHIENRSQTLIKQVQSLASWVMKFNPKQYVRDTELLQSEVQKEDLHFKNFTD